MDFSKGRAVPLFAPAGLLGKDFLKDVEAQAVLLEKIALGQTKEAIINLMACFKEASLVTDCFTLSKLLDEVDYCMDVLKYNRSVKFTVKTPNTYYYLHQTALDFQAFLQTKMASPAIRAEVFAHAMALDFPLKSPDFKPEDNDSTLSLVRTSFKVNSFTLKKVNTLAFLSDLYLAAFQSFHLGFTEYEELLLVPSKMTGLFYWADFYKANCSESFISEQLALYKKDPENYSLPFSGAKYSDSRRGFLLDEVILSSSLKDTEINDIISLAPMLIDDMHAPVYLKDVLLVIK